MLQKPNIVVSFLAFFCRICPFCICARRWPASRFARMMLTIEKRCPACRAYKALHSGERFACNDYRRDE